MPLQKAGGDMYDWVTHMHTHLGGECQHKCSYCYVQSIGKSKPAVRERYSGPVRLIEKEFKVNYGDGKTIFIDHLNDMWQDIVPDSWVRRILCHCRTWPDNEYVFQTRNPRRWLSKRLTDDLRLRCLLGVTIETNRDLPLSHAPRPRERIEAAMLAAQHVGLDFITIEPIMDFDVVEFVDMISACNPEFVNIGADSKRTELTEPSSHKVLALIEGLTLAGIEIRQKRNLDRLIKD